MAGLKEIRRRIKSVKSTKKITYAMKLVSAVKLRKAQDAVTRARDYTEALSVLLAELMVEQGEAHFTHPLMTKHAELKTVRLVVVSANRGLCGAYNTNINKATEAFMAEKARAGLKTETVLIGKKAAEHLRQRKLSYLKSYEKLLEDPNRWPLEDITLEFEQAFVKGQVDEVYVLYTKFKSALSMQVLIEKMLPLDEGTAGSVPEYAEKPVAGATLFEPSPQQVFDVVIPRVVRGRLRQACLESKASEQGSRMTAMENATKNAGELIDKLSLQHNKLRQSGITSQILDIIGGSQSSAQ